MPSDWSSVLGPLCGQLVMLGDQCQLPPTTLSKNGEHGLDSSLPLFTRLLREGVPPMLLDTQYRMHPAISHLPRDLFYAGRLHDGIAADARPAPRGFSWPRPDWPVAMVNVAHGLGERSVGSSYANDAEADVVCHLVDSLLEGRDLRASEIGVIAPYAAQVSMLRSRRELELRSRREVDLRSRHALELRSRCDLHMSATSWANASGR